jgi:hypothetical protein
MGNFERWAWRESGVFGSVVPSGFASYGGTNGMNLDDHGDPIFRMILIGIALSKRWARRA